MSDAVVVSTPSETITVPVETKDTEVEAQWLESSFAGINSKLTEQQQTLITVQECLNRLETRLPENLLGMMESQQRTITQLVHDSQETLRSLLTPTQEPLTTEIVAEPEPVHVENVVTQEPVVEPVKETLPKRRKI